jgi:hypothetical protein
MIVLIFAALVIGAVLGFFAACLCRSAHDCECRYFILDLNSKIIPVSKQEFEAVLVGVPLERFSRL